MIDLANMRLYELYQLYCKQRGLTANLKDYLKWVEDNYGD